MRKMPSESILLRVNCFLRFFVIAFLATTCSAPPSAPFSFVEGTIEELHHDLKTGRLSCEQVVQGYLDRIAAYDGEDTSVALHSIITVNSAALETARRKDRAFEASKPLPGLHCVPLVVKDNINVSGMPTTGGAVAFAESRPPENAFVVEQLLNEGAIVIGKANLDEFAFGFVGESSMGGLVKNAYNLKKGAGGSSSGTATAVASNLALAGIGTDTGGSIRVPSALAALIGLRPSMRLISQAGGLPLSSWQDTIGPMCRTVQDCALILDVIAKYDSSGSSNQRKNYQREAPLISSNREYLEITGRPESYYNSLDKEALKGARIGVVRALFGQDSAAVNLVNPVIEAAIDSLRLAGAEVEEVVIDSLDYILKEYISMSSYEFRHDLEKYLASWPDSADHHITMYEDLVASGGYLPGNERGLDFRGKILLDDLTEEQQAVYTKNTVERPALVRRKLMQTLENSANGEAGKPFDVIIYPALTGLAGELGKSPQTGSNNRLSPFSHFPALTMPVGMARHEGLEEPVGLEILAREFDELVLLNMAYAYQQRFRPRIPPVNTPDLAVH